MQHKSQNFFLSLYQKARKSPGNEDVLIKEVLENLTQSRADAIREPGLSDRVKAENRLAQTMIRLMAVAENYPDLKADQNFQDLQNELSDIENKIAAARRFFNNATREFNTSVQQFPAVILARFFGYTEEPFFDVDQDEKEIIKTPPDIDF